MRKRPKIFQGELDGVVEQIERDRYAQTGRTLAETKAPNIECVSAGLAGFPLSAGQSSVLELSMILKSQKSATTVSLLLLLLSAASMADTVSGKVSWPKGSVVLKDVLIRYKPWKKTLEFQFTKTRLSSTERAKWAKGYNQAPVLWLHIPITVQGNKIKSHGNCEFMALGHGSQISIPRGKISISGDPNKSITIKSEGRQSEYSWNFQAAMPTFVVAKPRKKASGKKPLRESVKVGPTSIEITADDKAMGISFQKKGGGSGQVLDDGPAIKAMAAAVRARKPFVYKYRKDPRIKFKFRDGAYLISMKSGKKWTALILDEKASAALAEALTKGIEHVGF